MMGRLSSAGRPVIPVGGAHARREEGFSLVELMMASLILLVVAGAIFGLLSRMQRVASHHADVQEVLESTRVALEIAGGVLRQAGNDPRRTGFPGITIVSATEVRVRSDLTGAGPGADKGDPDGDTGDAFEDVTIRYNASTRSVELVTGGSPQPVASGITAFAMRYYDAAGMETSSGEEVRRIGITLAGACQKPDPQTHKIFSMQLTGDVRLANR